MIEKLTRTRAYVDDLVTFSSSFDQHLSDYELLLDALIASGLTVKLSKCKFFRKKVPFLGHLITKNKLLPDLGKTKTISDWKCLTSIKSTRMFLGLANYYRNFIPHFAKIAEPLYALLRKEATFKWGNEEEKSFNSIKHALTSTPTLILPDPNKDYVLRTDASQTAVSAILLQKDTEGHLHPVAYGSHTLNSAQRLYTTTEREMLALVWGLQHYRQYLFRKLTWVTDHAALTHLLKYKCETVNQRIARWVLSLQDYDIKPMHEAGTSLVDADALSRIDAELTDVKINSISTFDFASIANLLELKTAQHTDPVCSLISKLVRGEVKVDDAVLNKAVKQLYSTHKFTHDDDGLLQLLWEPSSSSRSGPTPHFCTFIPQSLTQDVLALVHEDRLSGHAGIQRMYERIRNTAWWPNMLPDITSYIEKCTACQQRKLNSRTDVPVQPMTLPSAPWRQMQLVLFTLLVMETNISYV